MTALLRELVLVAIAGALSWWLFLELEPRTASRALPPAPARAAPLSLAMRAPDEARPLEAPFERAEPVPESELAVPAPERGTPEGEGELADAAPEVAEELPPEELPPEEQVPEEQVAAERPAEEPVAEELEPEEPQPAKAEEELADEPPASESAESAGPAPAEARAEDLMRDEALVAAATREVTDRSPKGFETTFLAYPEDQLEIARFFGEELVLVPRRALDPSRDDPRWFRIAREGPPRVETVRAPPPSRYRQYRDLFSYEYGRLPAALRELRRSVLSRDEVFLFAALVPPSEWALVIGRRREALARADREEDDVRRFVLRYVRRAEGGFDVEVEEILFADGSRIRLSET